jgi:hypothetical protein
VCEVVIEIFLTNARGGSTEYGERRDRTIGTGTVAAFALLDIDLTYYQHSIFTAGREKGRSASKLGRGWESIHVAVSGFEAHTRDMARYYHMHTMSATMYEDVLGYNRQKKGHVVLYYYHNVPMLTTSYSCFTKPAPYPNAYAPVLSKPKCAQNQSPD